MFTATVKSGPGIATVHELLAQIKPDIPCGLFSSFRTTLEHLSRCLQVPAEQVALDALVDANLAFRLYLEARRYKRNSVRSYCKFAGMLVAHAKRFGWEPEQPELSHLWEPILAAVAAAGCKAIVRYAMRHRIAPKNFSDNDLEAWGETMLDRGRTYCTVLELKRAFRRRLRDSGLAEKLPRLSPPQPCKQYGVRLSEFPVQLRTEVQELLTWKQAKYAQHRPRNGRQRAVTAEGLQNSIQRLYGFATKIKPNMKQGGEGENGNGADMNTLAELVTPEIVHSFVDWSINERGVLGGSVSLDVGMVYAAVRYYPALKDHKFGWLSELLKQIPRDSQSEVRERKLRKYVQYDVVAAIPNTIRGERQKLAGVFPKQIARLVRDELLMRWLTILPWRQRNIRECKINVHIYKRELPPMGGIETPRWVQENTRTNLQETFWQFEFRESETKNGERVLGILPRQLVPLLEEYLEHHRPLLLTDSDPGNLFLAKNGAPLDEKGVCELVEDLTVRYARKRVTPHLFRDIFAFKWLQDHPTDYLTLSKHLWHKDVQTTIQCYGFKFDTSHAVCQVEEWLDRRASSVSI